MPNGRLKLPSYRHHKPSGQAVVTLSGRDIYLGTHGTKLSKENYDRVVSEWLQAGRTLPAAESETFTVAQLINAFHKAATVPPSHADAYRAVMRLTLKTYARTPANDFGPLALKVVRQAMVDEGWKRKITNARVHVLRRIFKWGVEHQLIKPDGLIAMKAVEPLRKGKASGPESKKIKGVAVEHVEATIKFLPPTVQAMVRLQMLTGMRAGELVQMRTRDIDTTDPTAWVYRPESHKSDHLDKVKEIPLGRRARAIVEPLLLPDLDKPLFSPAKADAERRAIRTAKRKTPAGQGNVAGQDRPIKRRRPPGEAFTTASYRQAIDYAIEQAFPPPPHLARVKGERRADWRRRMGNRWQELLAYQRSVHWHPHQLRHNFGTRVINEFSGEHAQKSLGHTHMNTTAIYAKLSLDKAKEVARKIG